MNHFVDISIRASAGSLSQHPHAAYLASKAFRDKAEFRGMEALQNLVTAALFVLSKVALDPREVAVVRCNLEKGCVDLPLFQTVVPFRAFTVPVGSREHKLITEAVEENVTSRKSRAARSVLKWRLRSQDRDRVERAVQDRVRASLKWPTPEDYKAHREWAQNKTEYLVSQMHAHMDAFRDRRNRRLHQLSAAATPGLDSGWFDFLLKIAEVALLPQ